MRCTSHSAIVFACYEAACRPPTSGGTGGSKARYQHTTSVQGAEAIRANGFKVPKATDLFGPGVYLAPAGSTKAHQFYGRYVRQRQGLKTKHTTLNADVTLNNPIRLDDGGINNNQLAKERMVHQFTKQLGGPEAVTKMAAARYERDAETARRILREEVRPENPAKFDALDLTHPEDTIFWDFSEKAFNRFGERFSHETGLGYVESLRPFRWVGAEVRKKRPEESALDTLSRLARDAGFDGIEVDTRLWGSMGGKQTIVFDPAKVSIVAACYSKACAPPPAGHGGSDKHSTKSLFPHDEPQVVAPWPTAGRTKGKPQFDVEKVRTAIANPTFREFDPKTLRATQPWITRAGVEHYLKTDSVYADKHVDANKHPLVYERSNGQLIILAGHHRAAAAMIKGEPLRAIYVKE